MTTIPGEQPPTRTDKPQAISNLSVRVLTALVTLPIALYAAYVGGLLLTIVVGVVSAVGALEFYVFAQGRQMQGSALLGMPMVIGVVLAFHFQNNALWLLTLALGLAVTFILETLRHPNDLRRTLWQVATTMAGVVYIAFPASFIIVMRAIEPDGLMWLLLVFAATWGTDTFAYLGGRLFGRTKLAPVLSPKKTLEGAVVGILGGIVPCFTILALNHKVSLSTLIVISIAPLVAITGDLFESALKRFFNVKDSHIHGLNLFPGHGGVLDRVDSLLWVSTLFYGYLMLIGAGA
jgi:phosphatidate cytidylyltransferase